MSDRYKDYVSVAERLNDAADDLAHVETEAPAMITDSMGYIRARVALLDGRVATGTATFRLDLQGKGAQATNPIEDCETSAVGRALAFLGYSAKRSIASREEVQEAQRRAEYTPTNIIRPRPSAPNGKPAPTNGMTAADAKARFFERFGSTFGLTWDAARKSLGTPAAPEPSTVDGWLEVGRLAKTAITEREREFDAMDAVSNGATA